MRKFIAFVLIIALAAILVPGVKAASAQEAVQFIVGKNYYYIDGNRHNMDATTFVENGRTYVPIRFMGEALGAHVDWNGPYRLVTLTKGDKIVYLVVGVNKILVINKSDKLLDDLNQFFSRASDIDVAPIARNDRTYLPARFVAEALGYQVGWDASTGTVTISRGGVAPPPPVAADPFNPPIEWVDGGFPTIKVETAQKLFGPLVPPEELIGKNVTAVLKVGSRDVVLNPELVYNPVTHHDDIKSGTVLKNYLSVPYKKRSNEYIQEWNNGRFARDEKLSLPIIDLLKLEGFPEQNIFWDPERKIMVIYGSHFGQDDRYRVVRMIPGHEYVYGIYIPALIVENGIPVVSDDTLGGVAAVSFREGGIGQGYYIGDGYLFK